MLSTALLLLCSPVQQARAEARAEALEARAWELVESTGVPGVGLALVSEGKLVRAFGAGFTERDGEVEVTGDTVFSVGSISKTVAAWGLMELVEEGQLTLDAPVVTKRWMPPESAFDVRGVTLERLLSHTAGLTLHGYPGFWPGERALPTLEASLAGDTNGSGDVRLEAAPGSRWKYSGGGYTWAQLLLEETSGQSFAEFLQAKVLAPLGMTRSSYGWPEGVAEHAARPHDEAGEPGPRGGPCFPELAAAGLLTTASDLARFACASMPRFRDEAVLTRATLERMQTPVANSPDYGLGYQVWRVGQRTLVGHGGANLGWIAKLSIVPESGEALVVMTNSSNGSAVVGPLEKLWLDGLE